MNVSEILAHKDFFVEGKGETCKDFKFTADWKGSFENLKKWGKFMGS